MKSEKITVSLRRLRKKFGKTIIIGLLILLPLLGFLLGIKYEKNKNLPSYTARINDLNKQVAQKEEEIQLILEDKAKVESDSNSTYSYHDFGIYSPLFENKEVENKIYNYKRQIITGKDLILEYAQDLGKSSVAGVTVWEYTSQGSPSYDTRPYVIFGGYENYNSPRVIDVNPKDVQSYTNSKNIKMFWSYESCPKSICNVTLSFFVQYAPGGHPIYVQIWALTPSDVDVSYSYLNNAVINQTKEKLKKIADTIETSTTYH